MANRREFLRASAAVALSSGVPDDLFAQAANPKPPASASWDAGALKHLLPGVSDARFLIKASFNAPLADAPTLHVGGTAVRGRMGDTRGGISTRPTSSPAGPIGFRSPARRAVCCASPGSFRHFRARTSGRKNSAC